MHRGAVAVLMKAHCRFCQRGDRWPFQLVIVTGVVMVGVIVNCFDAVATVVVRVFWFQETNSVGDR